MESSSEPQRQPLVSVVIPCRNEEKYVERCIQSILNADYPADKTEIFVVDGLSTDNTPAILTELAKNNAGVNYLINEQQKTPYGLNQGINASSGEIIIILGAHSEIYPDYIRQCVNTLEENPVAACVGGVLENIFEDVVSETISLAMSSPFGVGSAHFRTGLTEGEVDTVAFGAYRKPVFDKVGLFDEELTRNQDDELNFRITKAGYKIILSKKIRSKYHVRASLPKLFSQYFQYGYWKVYVNKKHATVTTARQLAPLLLVVYFLSVFTLAIFDGIFFQIGLLTLCLYLAAGWLAALYKTLNPVKQLLIVTSFVTLHVSYGVGYLAGILYFILGNRSVNK